MRISDWSSDVCSSDLAGTVGLALARNGSAFALATLTGNQAATANGIESIGLDAGHAVYDAIALLPDDPAPIGASLAALAGEIHASVKPTSAERPVATASVRTCRSRWSPSHRNKTYKKSDAPRRTKK